MFTQGGPGDAGPRQLAGPLRSLRVCRWEALPGGGGRGHHVPREQRRLSVSGAPRELEVGRRPRWGRSGTRVEAQPARGGRPHPVPSDARIAAGPVVVDTADGASVPPGGGVLPSELPSFAAGPRRPPGTPSAAVWTHARRPAAGLPREEEHLSCARVPRVASLSTASLTSLSAALAFMQNAWVAGDLRV